MADFVAGRGTEALGIIGTVLGGVAVAAQGVLGAGGAGAPRTATGTDTVSKETFDLALRLTNSERDNAILTAELNTEKKMVEVYNALNDKINAAVANQTAINSAQAVNNCATASQLAVLNSTTAQLMGLTDTVVKNGKICPGWGDVKVSIVPDTTAAA